MSISIKSSKTKQGCPTVKLKNYQKDLLDTQKKLVVAIGLPLVGKSAQAIECAVRDVLAGHYDKLILIREPIQSKCGYLKGDHLTKMSPYTRQAEVYVAKNSQLTLEDLINMEKAEVSEPILLQGNRYERCIVIVDEAQNIHMRDTFKILTRVGEGCKFVIIGDISSGQKNERIKIEDSLPYYLYTKFGQDEEMREFCGFHTFYDRHNDILGDAFCKLIINKLYDDFVQVDDVIKEAREVG